MPKRKHHHNDYDEIRRKIKKLERQLHRVRDTSRDDREYRDRYYDYTDCSGTNSIRRESENSDEDIYDDFTEYPPPEDTVDILDFTGSPTHNFMPNVVPTDTPVAAPGAASTIAHTAVSTVVSNTAPITMPIAAPTASATDAIIVANQITDSTTEVSQKETLTELDSSILEILGVDPTDSVEYGKEIRKELASRFEHVATTGLSKEVRKELLEKYLIPSNCTKIGAPLMNAEIKAAVTEIINKRDKGIEIRQKQIACAISGLAGIINRELESTEKDNERLKHLMDVGRLLCDVQHQTSVTRRNFAIFSIKKDVKEHITNTKIDKYLFGESLGETLKTAKAVSKSGTDLKIKSQVRAVKPFSSTTSNLNWKTPAPARRQQGPQRSREPAYSATPGPSARHTRAPRPGNSSKPSQPPQRQHRRR